MRSWIRDRARSSASGSSWWRSPPPRSRSTCSSSTLAESSTGGPGRRCRPARRTTSPTHRHDGGRLGHLDGRPAAGGTDQSPARGPARQTPRRRRQSGEATTTSRRRPRTIAPDSAARTTGPRDDSAVLGRRPLGRRLVRLAGRATTARGSTWVSPLPPPHPPIAKERLADQLGWRVRWWGCHPGVVARRWDVMGGGRGEGCATHPIGRPAQRQTAVERRPFV